MKAVSGLRLYMYVQVKQQEKNMFFIVLGVGEWFHKRGWGLSRQGPLYTMKQGQLTIIRKKHIPQCMQIEA